MNPRGDKPDGVAVAAARLVAPMRLEVVCNVLTKLPLDSDVVISEVMAVVTVVAAGTLDIDDRMVITANATVTDDVAT